MTHVISLDYLVDFSGWMGFPLHYIYSACLAIHCQSKKHIFKRKKLSTAFSNRKNMEWHQNLPIKITFCHLINKRTHNPCIFITWVKSIPNHACPFVLWSTCSFMLAKLVFLWAFNHYRRRLKIYHLKMWVTIPNSYILKLSLHSIDRTILGPCLPPFSHSATSYTSLRFESQTMM